MVHLLLATTVIRVAVAWRSKTEISLRRSGNVSE